MSLRNPRLSDLFRVYQDLERTLRGLKATASKRNGASRNGASRIPIDVRKLILQLSRSKRRLERKIGNTLLLERHHLKRRIKALTSNLTARER